MNTWYATEQFAIADHTQRIQQAQERQRVRRAHITQRPAPWWTALLHLWRTPQAHQPATEQAVSH